MKKILYIIPVLTLLCFSCEDVIDVKLKEADKLLVIDAWIDDLPQAQTIRVTWSQAYFDAIPTEAISEAEVIVLRDDGEEFEFSLQANGNYVWSPDSRSSLGDAGNFFELSVRLDNEEYQSVAGLNPVPPVDRIETTLRIDDIQFDDGYNAQFLARDIAGRTDAYWIKTFKNGAFLNKPDEINTAFDAGFDLSGDTDGLIFIPPIRESINPVADKTDPPSDDPPSPYDPGDTIRVEIHSLSFDAFDYLNNIADQLLNSQSTIFALPLVNTNGNIFKVTSDGSTERVLGHFNVAYVSFLEHVVIE